jgi:hypothetical protein
VPAKARTEKRCEFGFGLYTTDEMQRFHNSRRRYCLFVLLLVHRHGRSCPAISSATGAATDGRDKPGHNGRNERRRKVISSGC